MFEYEAKVTAARPNSKSRRITLPEEVAKFMGDVEIGDSVIFKVEIIDKDKSEVKIFKKEK